MRGAPPISSDTASDHGGGEVSDPEAETAATSRAGGAPRPQGAMIGRYVVLEEIGRGAMGRVLRAYDPKLQREVALKEVRGFAADDNAAQRLVAEARAMAKLSHPNVVAVYDVEEGARGGPEPVTLVMQYVAGTTLSGWLRTTPRDWRSIVRAFIDAGRGLEAAHGAGILHRDFKPANVLVGSDGGIKVTDFGLAKGGFEASIGSKSAPSQSGSGPSSADALTEEGVVMGTPRYMAPEQHRGDELTPAADQYALCVALWEALCDVPPFAGAKLVQDKHRGPPAWPAGGRGVPGPISDAIRRGLAVSVHDRWPSLEDLLDALAHDPARRRKRIVLSGLGILGIAAVAFAARAGMPARAELCTGAHAQLDSAWGATTRARVKTSMLAVDVPYANAAWERSAGELDRYAQEWVTMHTDACEATSVRGEQSAAVMDLRMGCLQRARMDVQAATDQLAQADADLLMNAHQIVGGLPPLDRCADVPALVAQVEPVLPEEVERVDGIRARLAASLAARNAGRYDAAYAEVEEAMRLLDDVEYAPVHAEATFVQGGALDDLDRIDEAEDALRRALELSSKTHQWKQMRDAATRLIGLVGYKQRRPEEARRYQELARGLADGTLVPMAWVHNNIATTYFGEGKPLLAAEAFRRAVELQEQALGADHPDVATSRSNLALALQQAGKYAESEAEHRRALAAREAALGPDHPDVAVSLGGLASVFESQGRADEAEVAHRKALALHIAALGPAHPVVGAERHNLGLALGSLGKTDEASTELRRALSIWEASIGPDHPNSISARYHLAGLLREQGKLDEAESEHRRALAQRIEVLGPEHPHVAASRNELALVLADRGRHEESETEQREALKVLVAALGDDHPDVASIRINLADLLLARGEIVEALSLAETAWERKRGPDEEPGHQAESAFVLARALRAAGDPDRARTLARRAISAYERAGVGHAEDVAEVRRWLRERF